MRTGPTRAARAAARRMPEPCARQRRCARRRRRHGCEEERDEPLLAPCNYAEWSPTVTYGPGEVVMWLGVAYVAIGHNTARNPAVDSLYWSPYEDCQPPPPTVCKYPPWSRDATYKRADIALHWAIAWVPQPYIALANNGEGTNIVGGDPAYSDLSWKEYGGCTPPPPPPTTPCALLDPALAERREHVPADVHAGRATDKIPLDVLFVREPLQGPRRPSGLTAFATSGNMPSRTSARSPLSSPTSPTRPVTSASPTR